MLHSKVAGALAGLAAAGVIVTGSLAVASFADSVSGSVRDGQTMSSAAAAVSGEVGIEEVGEAHMAPALFDHHSIGVDEKPVRSDLFDHHSTEL